jgi:hypothetical protein
VVFFGASLKAEVVSVNKVIDLLDYKNAAKQRSDECEMLELEDIANTLCEEAWHLLVPMRMLKIQELTIDSTGSLLNIKYNDDSETRNRGEFD